MVFSTAGTKEKLNSARTSMHEEGAGRGEGRRERVMAERTLMSLALGNFYHDARGSAKRAPKATPRGWFRRAG